MVFPFKAIGFDWAHTLVDLGEEDDRKPLEQVYLFLKSKQISLPDFEDFLNKSRELFKSMIELSWTTHREARYEEVLQYLLFNYKVKWEGQTTVQEILKVYYNEVYQERVVFPEVARVLEQLNQNGTPMGIISNTTNPVFMKMTELENSGLKKHFDFALYSSNYPYRKPHPSIFQLAASHFQVPTQEILFVGDSLTADILGAQGVGMKTAWLNRKNKKAESNISPDFELNSLEDLLRIHWAKI
tara:strand:- start:110 stop:838 length:729 start_codon:yes stop_codon:yes gene_type:complete